MKKISKVIKEGLQPTPEDNRDIKFGALFSLPKLTYLPAEGIGRKPTKILDQFQTDMCAAFTAAAVSADQEKVELSPEYLFARVKSITGDPKSWGSDLRSIAKVLVKYGSLEASDNPYPLGQYDRDFIANWNNWNNLSDLDQKAISHIKDSYAFITGPYDVFDNIRATLWKNKDQDQTILTGCSWRYEWLGANKGIIDFDGQPAFGHAFKIFDWCEIDCVPYLKAQLSNGEDIGDKGVFYFSREIVNKCFTYGAITFVDMPPEKLKYYMANGMKADSNWLLNGLRFIGSLFQPKVSAVCLPKVEFANDLYYGLTHPDVKRLQQKLNENVATLVAKFGAGSKGQETAYYGDRTREAVRKWQKLNGVAETGYFGPISRNIINFKSTSMDPSQHLYQIAKDNLGNNRAVGNEVLGCAISLSAIHSDAFPNEPKLSFVNTFQWFDFMKSSDKWKQLDNPEPNCVIVSVGGQKPPDSPLSNGHIGIVGRNQSGIDGSLYIMSNNSNKKYWDTHFTLKRWLSYYQEYGKIPTYYFMKIK